MFRTALVWNPTKELLSSNCHLLESGLGSLGKRRANAPCKEGAAPLGMPWAPEGSCCQRSRPVLDLGLAKREQPRKVALAVSQKSSAHPKTEGSGLSSPPQAVPLRICPDPDALVAGALRAPHG